MVVQSRIFETFASEDAFLEAINGAMRAFDYERTFNADGTLDIRAPGHSAVTRWPKRRWRPFRDPGRRTAGYELPVAAAASFILRHFAVNTFYDIGASRGFLALLAASTEGRNIVAHAFEMQPDSVRKMEAERTARPELAQRFHPHLAGLSDSDEGARTIWFSRTRMFDYKPEPHEYREAWHRRLKFLLRGVKNRDRLQEARVTVTSIDAFAASNGAAPDFLKIDVDGFECKVIPGGMDTFARTRPFLLLELHKDDLLRRFGQSRRDVVQPLLDAGYYAAHIDDHNETKASGLTRIAPDDAIWSRQTTDMFLFY